MCCVSVANYAMVEKTPGPKSDRIKQNIRRNLRLKRWENKLEKNQEVRRKNCESKKKSSEKRPKKNLRKKRRGNQISKSRGKEVKNNIVSIPVVSS